MRTNICSFGAESMAKHIRPLVSQLPDEIVTRFYGCGTSPEPGQGSSSDCSGSCC